MAESDQDLEKVIERARAGDAEALTDLFECHRGRLMRMIQLRMDQRVRARVAVSDVLQEAYIDLATQLHNYAKDPKLPFFLWLRRITGQRLAKIHRLHLGQAKRDAGRDISLDQRVPNASSVCLASHLMGRYTSAAGRLARQEIQLKVQESLETLSDQDHEIIALRHVEQLSNSEMAIVLDISESAASKRYVRALRRLRDALRQFPGMLD